MEQLLEFALPRAKAIDRCLALSEKFVEHFNKIYNNPNSVDAPHWAGEMKGWFNSICKIRLQGTNKPLTFEFLRKYFFLYDSEYLFDLFNNDITEIEAYYTFLDFLSQSRDIKQALEDSGII